MPFSVQPMEDQNKHILFRVVDDDGKIAVHKHTKNELDAGGHTDNQKALRQAGHLNAWEQKKKDKR